MSLNYGSQQFYRIPFNLNINEKNEFVEVIRIDQFTQSFIGTFYIFKNILQTVTCRQFNSFI